MLSTLTLLTLMVGLDWDISLEDEAKGAVVGHVVPYPVQEDNHLITHREYGAQVYDEP